MVVIEDLSQIETMSRQDFDQQFSAIVNDKAFTHVVAGEGARFEIQDVGEALFHAGIRCISIRNDRSIMAVVDALTKRLYRDAKRKT